MQVSKNIPLLVNNIYEKANPLRTSLSNTSES